MKLGRLFSTAVAALALSAAANAQPIVGGISFSDGFDNLPTAPTTTIVSAFGFVDVGGLHLAQNCTGAFTGCPAAGVFANNFTVGSPGVYFTYGGFTFTVTNVAAPVATPLTCDIIATDQCSDGLRFTAAGVVTGNGFDPTLFLLSWTATGNCTQPANAVTPICGSNITGSWAASITATGRVIQIPEPGTLALLGLGLSALGFSRRKKKV